MNINVCTRNFEFRAADPKDGDGEGDGRTLEGYIAVFDQDTEIDSWEGRFIERIAKGAFKKTLRERKPVLQFNHGRDMRTGSVPIGRFTELREEDKGLYQKARLFANDAVEPVREAIAEGAIDGMSFTFEAVREKWTDRDGKAVKGDELFRLLYEPGDRGPITRTLTEVKMYEAGPVVFPAYEGTSVGVRDLDISDDDRKRLITEYRKSLAQDDDDDKELRSWLDAEKSWQERCSAWLAAETAWHAEEKTARDAAHKGTSQVEKKENDPDAAHKGTSREQEEKTTRKETRAMNIDELRERISTITSRMKEIGEAHPDSTLPEDDQKEYDELETELGTRQDEKKGIETRIANLKKLAEDHPEQSERGQGTGSRRHETSDNLYDLEELRKSSFTADDFVERATRNAKKVLETAHFPAAQTSHGRSLVGPKDVREGLMELLERDSSDGELAKRILMTGSPMYERAFGKIAMAGNTNMLSVEEHRAMAIGTDASGNFAVPFQLDPTIVHLGSGYISPLRSLAKVVTLVGKEWQTLTITEATVYRAAEAAAAIDGSPVLAQAVLRVGKVHGFIPFSMEAEEDWPGMKGELFSLLNEAKDKEEANSFMTGNGTPPNPSGLITGATTTVAAGSGLSITAADVYKLEESLPIEHRDNAAFLGSKSVYNKLRQLDTGGGANLWVRINDKTPNQLIGYPAYEASYGFPATTPYTNGQKLLIFGNFKKFVILDRVGMNIELIPHLFDTAGAGSLPTGQRGLYAHWRNNSKVTDPGAFRVLTATT